MTGTIIVAIVEAALALFARIQQKQESGGELTEEERTFLKDVEQRQAEDRFDAAIEDALQRAADGGA